MEEDIDDVVRLTIAAIATAESDVDVHDALRAQGLSDEVAARATTLVPLAFGRQWLEERGARLPTDYVVHRPGLRDEVRPLENEVIYRRARALSASEHFAAAERCVAWSAEANAALGMSPPPRDLSRVTFSPLVQVRGDDPRPLLRRVLREAPVSKELDVPSDPLSVRSSIERMLGAHGVEMIGRTPGAPRWTARIYPHALSAKSARLQLDVRVRSARLGERVLIESCGASAPTAPLATRQALDSFMRSSLHPLLSALHDHEDAEHQVERERWTSGAERFEAHIGRALWKYWGEREDVDLSPLLDEVRDVLLEQPLGREIHWLRLYAFRGPAFTCNEALLDNERCERLEAALANWPLTAQRGPIQVRLFLVLVPADD